MNLAWAHEGMGDAEYLAAFDALLMPICRQVLPAPYHLPLSLALYLPLPCISPVSRLYLPHISVRSRSRAGLVRIRRRGRGSTRWDGPNPNPKPNPNPTPNPNPNPNPSSNPNPDPSPNRSPNQVG